MSKLTVFVLVLISFTQISVGFTSIPPHELQSYDSEQNLESRAGVILQMTKKVLQLKLNVTKTWVQESDNIAEYKNLVNSEVRESLRSIKSQIKDLDEQVRNATEQAVKTNTNIYSCIKKEKKDKSSKIRTRSLSKCRRSGTYNVLKLTLSQLLAIKVEACSFIPTCVLLHPLSNRALKNCIQKKLDDASLQIQLIKWKIDDAAADIYEAANSCVQENLGNLDLVIEQISDDFSECVEQKMNNTMMAV